MTDTTPTAIGADALIDELDAAAPKAALAQAAVAGLAEIERLV